MVQQQQQTIASPVSDDTIPNTATTTTNHFKRFSAPLLSMNAGNNTGMAGDADAAATGPTWDINNARRHASMPAIMEQSFFAGPMPSSSSSQDLSATVDADGMPRKPHVCPWPNCNKTFTRSAHLTRHVRAHGGEKPYSCPHEGCGKRFSRSDVLKEHIRIHDGNRVRKRRVRGSSDSNSSSSSSHQASAAAVAAAAAAKRNSIAATTSLAAAAEQSTAQLFAIPPPLTCRAPNGMGTMPNPAFPVSSFRSCEAQPSPDMHPYAHYQPQASLSPREPSLSSSPPYIHDSCSQGTTGSGAVATTMSIQPNSSFNALLGMESVAHFDRSGSSWQHQQQQQVTQRGAAVVSGSYSATPYQHHHNHHHQHQQQDGSYPVAAAYSNMPQTATHYSSSSPLSNHGPSHSSSNNNNNQPMTLATMAAVASMEADLMGLQQNWSSVPSQQQQQQPPRYESTQYAPSYYSQQAM
ncbi:hypothetical protein BGW39_005664 [Mortierella sp. 14UC]|nr:hypothetical protein BGW39_005664 [Mortierella sp. 14UC]